MNKGTKLLCLLLSVAILCSFCGTALASAAVHSDTAITLDVADAAYTGQTLGVYDTTYDSASDAIINIGPNSTITYTVPDDISGSYDIYLNVGKIDVPYGCTPFYISINGDDYTVPIIHFLNVKTKTENEFGLFAIRTNVDLKAGDEITVIGQLGFEFGTFKNVMPPVGDVVLYPAGTAVGVGYNNELPVTRDIDPHDPLSGLNIVWLGSSVTYGQNADGYSMADYIAEMHPATNCYKYTISGTTLVDETASSYVTRMKYIDKSMDVDYFIVQLSTNDASQNKTLGELSDSFEMDDFDTTTIYGAMEYIIAYAQETWGCPVLFYSGSYYRSEAYANMVQALLNVQEKWGIDIIDLWNNEDMTALFGTKLYKSYMADNIHPKKLGYTDWWGPEFEKVLENAVLSKNHYAAVDSVTAGYGDVIELNVNAKNNETGFSSYRVMLDSELDINVTDITSAYELEWNKVEDGYYVIVYTADGSLITGDTTLFTLTVDLTDTVYSDGDYELDLTVIDGTTVDDAQIALYSRNGTLTIANNYPAGDANLDCKVTNADVITIARYLVELISFTDTQFKAADINNDGIINNKDLVLVARAVVGK